MVCWCESTTGNILWTGEHKVAGLCAGISRCSWICWTTVLRRRPRRSRRDRRGNVRRATWVRCATAPFLPCRTFSMQTSTADSCTPSVRLLSLSHTLGHFIFRLNLSFKPKLKPKFGLKPKLIRKIKWRQSSVTQLYPLPSDPSQRLWFVLDYGAI